MARFPKTIGDVLAGHAAQSRDMGTSALTVPELEPIGIDHLASDLQDNITTVNTDMASVKNTMTTLNAAQANAVSDLNQLHSDLADLGTDLTALDGQMVGLRSDLAVNSAAQANNAAALVVLDGQLASNNALVSNTMTGLRTDLTGLSAEMNTVPTKINTAVSAAQAIPLTNERFTASSLTIWPFVNLTVPKNAFAVGAVTGPDLANFAVSANKLSIKRHVLF